MFPRIMSLFALSIFLTAASAKNMAGFALFFQPLYEMPPNVSQAYIKEFRAVLERLPSKNIDSMLLRSYQNDICAKKRMKTCVHGLYKINSCVKPATNAAKLCAQKSLNQNTSKYFEESVFNRLNWNHFALQISRHCQRSQEKTCFELNKLHKKYFDIYKKFIKNRRNKKKKDWDL